MCFERFGQELNKKNNGLKTLQLAFLYISSRPLPPAQGFEMLNSFDIELSKLYNSLN